MYYNLPEIILFCFFSQNLECYKSNLCQHMKRALVLNHWKTVVIYKIFSRINRNIEKKKIRILFSIIPICTEPNIGLFSTNAPIMGNIGWKFVNKIRKERRKIYEEKNAKHFSYGKCCNLNYCQFSLGTSYFQNNLEHGYSVYNISILMPIPEAATGGVLCRKMSLKISQNSTGIFLWILRNF